MLLPEIRSVSCSSVCSEIADECQGENDGRDQHHQQTKAFIRYELVPELPDGYVIEVKEPFLGRFGCSNEVAFLLFIVEALVVEALFSEKVFEKVGLLWTMVLKDHVLAVGGVVLPVRKIPVEIH